MKKYPNLNRIMMLRYAGAQQLFFFLMLEIATARSSSSLVVKISLAR